MDIAPTLNKKQQSIKQKNPYLYPHKMNTLNQISPNQSGGYVLSERSFSSDGYRFAYRPAFSLWNSGRFNGMEKSTFAEASVDRDNELKGSGNSYDFGARLLDVRLGRWLAVDPLSGKYSGLSSYNFVANSPVILIDPDENKIKIVGGLSYRLTVYKTMVSLMVNSNTGRGLVLRAITSEKLIIITENKKKDNQEVTTPDKSIVIFNPIPKDKESVIEDSGENGDDIPETNETSFAHELAHAMDDSPDKSKLIYIGYEEDSYGGELYYTANTISAGEINAVETENKVRSEMGLPLRAKYSGILMLHHKLSAYKKVFTTEDGEHLGEFYTTVEIDDEKQKIDFKKLQKENLIMDRKQAINILKYYTTNRGPSDIPNGGGLIKSYGEDAGTQL